MKVQSILLNFLRISEGIPARAANKWRHILSTCWNNIFDGKLLISNYNFVLMNDNKRLTINFVLPPVENKNTYFKNDIFMISLSMSDIICSENLQEILNGNIESIELSISYIEDGLFEIFLYFDNKYINLKTNDILISSLYKKDSNDFKLIF
ncbi:hypothetical protein [Neisseria weaveri]|uniref:hypothetical protein n=1 Tax=Neisseria weaveri TaxID=28091 RepID=UPI000D2FA743|nr:hypothetical protein [Neisseria weaveri]